MQPQMVKMMCVGGQAGDTHARRQAGMQTGRQRRTERRWDRAPDFPAPIRDFLVRSLVLISLRLLIFPPVGGGREGGSGGS